MTLFIKVGTRYRTAPVQAVCEAAANYLLQPLNRGPALANPRALREFIKTRISQSERELFMCLFLDNRHRVIGAEVMFEGTVDGASVHPREVVKRALDLNAVALIFAHNHPSGVAEPSQADEIITGRLRDALALVDIRVLDHVIVSPGSDAVSFAERGLI